MEGTKGGREEGRGEMGMNEYRKGGKVGRKKGRIILSFCFCPTTICLS